MRAQLAGGFIQLLLIVLVLIQATTGQKFHNNEYHQSAECLLPKLQHENSLYTPNLIFDIGMFDATDTVNWLKNGYSVVAVEAIPTLVEEVSKKLENYITGERLVIVSTGLAEESKVGTTQTFFVHEKKPSWSSFDPVLGCRINDVSWHEKPDFSLCKPIEVPMSTCGILLKKFGVPEYLKVDIEGRDIECISHLVTRKLQGLGVPRYVSMEVDRRVHRSTHLALLIAAGYQRVKLFDQKTYHTQSLFGEEAIDRKCGRQWRSMKSAAMDPTWGSGNDWHWLDLHATLEPGEVCE